MTDIEIKNALKIPMSEEEKLKQQLEEIFNNVSLEDCFRKLLQEQKYHGIFKKIEM